MAIKASFGTLFSYLLSRKKFFFKKNLYSQPSITIIGVKFYLYKRVPPIRIKLEITPVDGSAKPHTFSSFREAAEYTGLSISGLRVE